MAKQTQSPVEGQTPMGSIDHVVVLMLENRSFDQMLGYLYFDFKKNQPSRSKQEFDGLTGNESCPDQAMTEVKVFPITSTTPHPYNMPGANPREGFLATNVQLFGTENPQSGVIPNNKGFIASFAAGISFDQAKGYRDTIPGVKPTDIMGMYHPDMLPVMSTLARSYAVCDCWFASVPTQTLPNRAFVNAGTSLGSLDNSMKYFGCKNIFGELAAVGADWAIYGYNGTPRTKLDFPDTRDADSSHFGHFQEFQERARDGKLPTYTFLEPSWGASGNSQHPNYDVATGEQLISDVYNTLCGSPKWNQTLLIIIYDEHGGNYDHATPPSGVPAPDKLVGSIDRFQFDRLGIRIPAILISPLIKEGTVFRPTDSFVDHTSVIKTLCEKNGIKPWNPRIAAASSLAGVLTLQQPRVGNVLTGVTPPAPSYDHPQSDQPSELDLVHANQLASLQIPNEYGGHDHEMPQFTNSAEVANYIHTRHAAWNSYQQRRKQMTLAPTPSFHKLVSGANDLQKVVSTQSKVAGNTKPKKARNKR